MKPFFASCVAALHAAALFGLQNECAADVRLPGVLSDHMVLQRGRPIVVWGWADNAEAVKVTFRDQLVSTTAADGKWRVELKAVKEGGPDTLTVEGKNTIVVKDILVGEVWVCSGQSNMQWAMTQTFQPDEAINSANNPNLRLYYVPRVKATEPRDDIDAKWQTTSPDSVRGFSAVAYYFGRALQSEIGVPVGLIHTSWGGSPAEVWMREPVLAANSMYKGQILDPYYASLKNYEVALAAWEKEKAALEADGKKMEKQRPGMGGWRPSELYNAMIAPLLNYGIAGAIWYQGESNAGRAWQYRHLMADMISNWREDFRQGDFPFLQVQLAPWDKNRKRSIEEITAKPGDSDWAELREAQLLATKVIPNVGMVVITDVGDKDDIHPAKKGPVGDRLAHAALSVAYKKKGVHFGPVYRSSRILGNRVVLQFDHVGQGLEAKGEKLTGFEIAGADRKFVWANARIQDGRVSVSSPEVPNPVAVRYGWSDFPVVNLWNKDGFPATPFRTDNFPMITGPRFPN